MKMTVAAVVNRDAASNHFENEKPDTFVNLYLSYCTSYSLETAKNSSIVQSQIQTIHLILFFYNTI
jgi:hypothetical protein